MEESLKSLYEKFELKGSAADTYSPLTLAYIGDAVYELIIRNIVIASENVSVHLLHKKTIELVNAKKQSEIIEKIKPLLTEKEMSIFRRGRNAKAETSAKNASIGDYRRATGFEALVGYLYLNGEKERMITLVKTGLSDEEEDK